MQFYAVDCVITDKKMKQCVLVLGLLLCLRLRLALSNGHRVSIERFNPHDPNNIGPLNDRREKRAVTLADLGAAAIKVMVKGASESQVKNSYALMYEKAGSVKAAIRDFKEIGTVNNRKVITKDGGSYYEGVAGDRTIRLRIQDKRHQGQPTILAFDATKQRQYKSQVQVVYTKQQPRSSGWN